jgi:mannose-6-phosphate isomerase
LEEFSMQTAFTLQPEYRDYVWGGQSLRPGQLTAEAWIVFEGDRIATGPLAGQTLAEAAARDPLGLLGQVPVARTGARFPLLIKLLDCAQWLSVQVHPNDEQALRLEGAGQFGKTEAWHFLKTEPGAEILAGLRPGTTSETLAQAIQAGKALLDAAQHLPVRAGESLFIPAGMLHALGPGMLLYEVQQTSNITYRVYDWDRPASAGRPLHIAQSLAVTNPALTGQIIPPPALKDSECVPLIRCPYFTLAAIQAARQPLTLDPGGKSFHILTVTQGGAHIQGTGWQFELQPLQTLLVPASAGPYALSSAAAPARVLLAYVA